MKLIGFSHRKFGGCGKLERHRALAAWRSFLCPSRPPGRNVHDVELGEGAQWAGWQRREYLWAYPWGPPLGFNSSGGWMSNVSRKPGGCDFPANPTPRMDIYSPLLSPCRHRSRSAPTETPEITLWPPLHFLPLTSSCCYH